MQYLYMVRVQGLQVCLQTPATCLATTISQRHTLPVMMGLEGGSSH